MSIGNVNISIKNEEALKIEINNNTSLYSYNELIDYDKRFRAFHSIKHIYLFILSFIERKEYKIEDNNLLILPSIGKDIIIPIKYSSFINLLDNLFYKIIQIKSKFKHSLKLIQTIQAKGWIYSLCKLKDGRLVSGGEKRIVIYNKDTYNSDIIIPCGTGSLCVLKNGNLASALRDICIWEINGNEYKLIHTLKGHTKSVLKVIEMFDGKLCSCSSDKTIKIWDENYQCIQTLTGHIGGVRSIIEMNDYLISVDCNKDDYNDSSVRIWNKSTYQTIKVIQQIYCYSNNSLCKLKENTLILGGYNKIFIIDILSFKYQTLEDERLGYIFSICVLRDGKVLLGNGEGEIIYFHSSSNQFISTQKIHNKAISCIIESEDNKIFSCSDDGSINVYD